MDIRITNNAWDRLFGNLDFTAKNTGEFKFAMDKFASNNNARFVNTPFGLILHFDKDQDYFLFLLKHGDIENAKSE